LPLCTNNCDENDFGLGKCLTDVEARNQPKEINRRSLLIEPKAVTHRALWNEPRKSQ